MASDPFTSWQIDGETKETVTDFIFLGSEIIADGDYSHGIKRCLILGRQAMTNLDSILKSRDITLPTQVHPVMWTECESCTVKKAESQRIDALNCVALKKTRESPLDCKEIKAVKKINPEYSLEGLMLKLKLQYFGHLM